MATNAERAQIGRINRLLAQDGQVLRKIREDSRWFAQYGPYMTVDIDTNGVAASGISDLAQLEAELIAERSAAKVAAIRGTA